MKTVAIKLYGAIEADGENSAASFISKLTEAQKTADVIELHLHSPGGEVFEGTAIFNAIKDGCGAGVSILTSLNAADQIMNL